MSAKTLTDARTDAESNDDADTDDEFSMSLAVSRPASIDSRRRSTPNCRPRGGVRDLPGHEGHRGMACLLGMSTASEQVDGEDEWRIDE